MEYCPVCGSIDIVAGHCQHCGSEAAESDLLQFEPGAVVKIIYPAGKMIVDAQRFHQFSDSKFKNLIGGTPSEKRKNVRHR